MSDPVVDAGIRIASRSEAAVVSRATEFYRTGTFRVELDGSLPTNEDRCWGFEITFVGTNSGAGGSGRYFQKTFVYKGFNSGAWSASTIAGSGWDVSLSNTGTTSVDVTISGTHGGADNLDVWWISESGNTRGHKVIITEL